MSAPITPAEVKATLPSSTASLCGNFVKALLQFPVAIYKLVKYMLADDGALSEEFIADLATEVFPTGSYLYAAGTITSTKFLRCDGTEYQIASYPALFAVIGVTYGGNGTTTFMVPNMEDRFPIGKSTSKLIGTTGGEETHVLTVPELPAHTHTYNRPVATAGLAFSGGGDYTTSNVQTGSTGGDTAHNNMPPWMAQLVYIRI